MRVWSRGCIRNRRNIRLGGSQLETLPFLFSSKKQRRELRGRSVISFHPKCTVADYPHRSTCSFLKLIWYFHGDRDARLLRLAGAYVWECAVRIRVWLVLVP